MISVPWSTVVVSFAVVVLAGVIIWLWQRTGRPGPRGINGLTGRDGRDGRDGRSSITEATADLIVELSCELEQLKKKVHALELGAQDAQNRITILQSELALANSEITAFEQLIKEQAARIGDLRSENENLRRSMARVMKRTGTLTDDSDSST